MHASKEKSLLTLEKMMEIRLYEETLTTIFLEDKLPLKKQKGLAFDIGAGPVPGEIHLATGQEPVAVGI